MQLYVLDNVNDMVFVFLPHILIIFLIVSLTFKLSVSKIPWLTDIVRKLIRIRNRTLSKYIATITPTKTGYVINNCAILRFLQYKV